jgi:hypothetical protein
MATMTGVLNQRLVIVGAPLLGFDFDRNGHRCVMAGIVGVPSQIIWFVFSQKFNKLGGGR